MIRRYFSVILTIGLLLGILLGSVLWMQIFYGSIKNYRSPLETRSLPAQPPALPKTARVVIVVISGLGYETTQLLDLPMFEQLSQVGATVVVQSTPPTYSQTARMTIVTGAPPEINGAPPFDQPPEALTPSPMDTIFARAHETRLRTALLGKDDWEHLIPNNQLDESFFVALAGPESDQAILQAAMPILKDDSIDLALIQFSELEFWAKRQINPDATTRQAAAARIDEYLGQISRTIDLSDTILVILGDHGFTDTGGQGGDEPELIQQPLIMIGKGIIPGAYTNVRQIDIAPTVSTLLGAAPPAVAYGRIMFEMLDLSEHNRTIAQLTLAQQRLGLADAYLAQVSSDENNLPDSLFADLARARATFAENNLKGAFQLALLVQEAADTQISVAKQNRVRDEQLLRLIVAVAVLFVWLGIMWRRRGKYAGILIIVTLITIILYHALYQLQGHNYSISSFNNFSQLPFDIARRTVVSLIVGGALVLVFLLLTGEEDWAVLLGTAYGFANLMTFAFALPLFWAFWQNGLKFDWYFPAALPVFWQVISLLEIMIAATLGLLLPWPIMFLSIFVLWVRRHLSKTPSQREPGTLPGLRL